MTKRLRTRMRAFRNLFMASLTMLGIAVGMFSSAPLAHAASQAVWLGGTDNNMGTASNWQGDVLPQAGDTIVFNSFTGPIDPGYSNQRSLKNNLGVTLGGVIVNEGDDNGVHTDYIYNVDAIQLQDGAQIIENQPTTDGHRGVFSVQFDSINSGGSLTLTNAGANNINASNVTLSGSSYAYGGTITNLILTSGTYMSTDMGYTNGLKNVANIEIQNASTLVMCTGTSVHETPVEVNSSLTFGGGSGADPAIVVQPCMGAVGAPSFKTPDLSFTGNITLSSDASITTSGGSAIAFDNQLLANGHLLTVSTDGAVSGNGYLGNVNIQPGGWVAPGHSPGILNVTNLNEQGTYQAQLGGTEPGTGYDQIVVTGSVNLSGTLDVELYGGFIPTAGQIFEIINNDGSDPAIGTFQNLAEGAKFSVAGYLFQITYTGGDGNDVVLTALAGTGAPNTSVRILTLANPLVAAGAGVLAIGALVIAVRARR